MFKTRVSGIPKKLFLTFLKLFNEVKLHNLIDFLLNIWHII